LFSSKGCCDYFLRIVGWNSITKWFVFVVFKFTFSKLFLFDMKILLSCGLFHPSTFHYFTLYLFPKVQFSIVIFLSLWARIGFLITYGYINILFLILYNAFILNILLTYNVWKCFYRFLINVIVLRIRTIYLKIFNWIIIIIDCCWFLQSYVIYVLINV